MTDQNRNDGSDRPQQNTGAGSRQQEQQSGGGGFENERQNPGGTGLNQSGADQMQQGGSYRPQGDRGVQFEADQGQETDFQPEQQNGASGQQDFGEGLRGEGLGSDAGMDSSGRQREGQTGGTGQQGEQSGYAGSRGGIGSQQEQQSGNRGQQGGPGEGQRGGSGTGADTRGGNQTNR